MSVRRNSGERKRRAYSTFPSDVWVFLQRRQRNTDDYGQYGWKNTKNVDLSVYNHIVLEIEATDSRVEIYVLYEGLEKSTCIGGIDAGKTKAVCELEHIDKVQAIYIAKSKVGITKIVKFVLTDEID